jgi:GntP family gluconate:H+ symporter
MATMIGVGSIVGLIAALAGYVYACWADKTWPLQPRRIGLAAEGGDEHAPLEEAQPPATPATLPPLWAALLPILLPVVLISLESVSQSAPAMFSPTALSAIRLVGEKNVALSLAALAAILVLYRVSGGMPAVRRTIAEAVTEAGGIILVIAAGGALGGALRQAGLAQLSAGLATGAGIAVIPIAWLVTAIIRMAQGSATVAMITAAGVMAPIVLDGSLACHPVYVAVAIGCGSKIGMWMNDSGFWVISRMSGMSETQTLRSASVMVLVEGTVGLAATLAMALAWPMQ